MSLMMDWKASGLPRLYRRHNVRLIAAVDIPALKLINKCKSVVVYDLVFSE
jgi:hypothetical protein